MDVTGIVVSFEDGVQVAKKDGGSYPGARFSYRDDTGALKEKGFHANTFKFNAALKTQLSNLKTGQPFVMNMEKQGEFWNVKSVLPASGNAAPATIQEATKTTPFVSPKSTYETPEERAKKQIYIVRQSSINQALEYTALVAQTDKKLTYNVESILKTAKQFEAHVFGEAFDDGMPLSMQDDSEGIV
jgi:hypothetical protein